MNNKNKKLETLPFVKFYTGLSYFFNPAETRFILHMVDIEFKKKSGFNTDWSRAEYMKIMGLNEYTFDKCIKRMLALGLLSKRNNDLGNKVYYSFDMQVYEKLVTIITSTNYVDALIDFCASNFADKPRTIESISDGELEALRARKQPKIGFWI